MNFKKLLVLSMTVLTMVTLVGCGSTKNAGQELPKKVVIGLDDAFAPMGFRNDKGELVGFDIDMAKEAAARANIEIEFKPIDWSSKEAELKSKHIDILWNGLTITEKRKEQILFSDPYIQDKQILVVRADSPIKTKEDLAGKLVGTQMSSTAQMMIEREPISKEFKELKLYNDYVNAFMDLQLNRIEAVVVNGNNARYTLKDKMDQYRIIDVGFPVDFSGVGFRKEDTALRDRFNQILADMKKDGTADKIAIKWYGSAEVLTK